MNNDITQERVTTAIKKHKDKRAEIEFPDDVEKIHKIIKEVFEVTLSHHDVVDFWEWYSEEFLCAGWLINPTFHDVERGFPKWILWMEGMLWDEGHPLDQEIE